MKRRTRMLLASIALCVGAIVLVAYWSAWYQKSSTQRSSDTGKVQSPKGESHASKVSATNDRRRVHTSHYVGRPTKDHLELPPDGAPLKDTYAQLKARADAGDSAAASRLFHDSNVCAQVAQSQERISRESSSMSGKLPQLSKLAMFGINMDLDRMQRDIDFVKQNSALCDGLSPKLLNTALPNALQAAQLGDPTATNCYVGANIGLSTDGALNHPEWLTQYKSNALDLAQNAVTRGDWTMVSLLAHSYAGDYKRMWLAQVTGTNIATAYGYFKLWSLGMGQTQGSSYFAQRLSELSSKLSPAEIEDADNWAAQTYNQYFADDPSGAGIQTTACPN